MSKARDWVRKMSEAVTERPQLTLRGQLIAEVDHAKADCIIYNAALTEQEANQLIAWLKDQFE